ncbi:MAG: hypothetical protein IPL33_16705 [Sphingobacteriales bacterium]|nr:hypothetical protein [Sphingobacteriales bacterium]
MKNSIDRQTPAENGSQLCFEQEIPGYYVDFSTDDDINLPRQSVRTYPRFNCNALVWAVFLRNQREQQPAILNSFAPQCRANGMGIYAPLRRHTHLLKYLSLNRWE